MNTAANRSAKLKPLKGRPDADNDIKCQPKLPKVSGPEPGQQLPRIKLGKEGSFQAQERPDGTQVKGGRKRTRSIQARHAYKTSEKMRAQFYRQAVGRRNAFDHGRPLNKGRGGSGNRPTPRTAPRPERSAQAGPDSERANSSMATVHPTDDTSRSPTQMKNDQGLTNDQIWAFQEVFDLFDSNGGGTIDADELDAALRTVDICLTHDEIYDVLMVMDKDGNGEIDFAEFLQLMTNTERFIEAISSSNLKGRETLLFDALTEFMKVSALQSMDEIVGYYSHKYKRSQTPHVVNHYAAGARLIGLTERQLKEHLEHLKASNAATGPKGLNSPYAQPLHILNSNTSLNAIAKLKHASGHHQRAPKAKLKQGRIRLSFKIDANGDDGPRREELVSEQSESTSNRPMTRANHHNQYQLKLPVEGVAYLHHVPVSDRGFGWASKRTEHIEVRLPAAHMRKLVPFDELTAEDLPAIRTNVSNATRDYTHHRRQEQLRNNYKHWKALEVALISPKILRDHFRVIFSHYSYVPLRHLAVVE